MMDNLPEADQVPINALVVHVDCVRKCRDRAERIPLVVAKPGS
jgi:hypothetical protein